jgi:hypothetical protein
MRKNGGLRESGMRSKLEERFAAILEEAGIEQEYEVKKIKYVVPESNHTYLIDFSPLKLNIEVKGLLRDYDERHKYQLVKEQHPSLDLRFVFDSSSKKVPGTKMSHAEWAEKQGFKSCDIKDKETILGWLQEDNNNKKES